MHLTGGKHTRLLATCDIMYLLKAGLTVLSLDKYIVSIHTRLEGLQSSLVRLVHLSLLTVLTRL